METQDIPCTRLKKKKKRRMKQILSPHPQKYSRNAALTAKENTGSPNARNLEKQPPTRDGKLPSRNDFASDAYADVT